MGGGGRKNKHNKRGRMQRQARFGESEAQVLESLFMKDFSSADGQGERVKVTYEPVDDRRMTVVHFALESDDPPFSRSSWSKMLLLTS